LRNPADNDAANNDDDEDLDGRGNAVEGSGARLSAVSAALVRRVAAGLSEDDEIAVNEDVDILGGHLDGVNNGQEYAVEDSNNHNINHSYGHGRAPVGNNDAPPARRPRLAMQQGERLSQQQQQQQHSGAAAAAVSAPRAASASAAGAAFDNDSVAPSGDVDAFWEALGALKGWQRVRMTGDGACLFRAVGV
jgi:hypothetical protein